MSFCRIQQLELCHREMFGNMIITCANPNINFVEPLANFVETVKFPVVSNNEEKNKVPVRRSLSCCDEIRQGHPDYERRRASALVDELLVEIYNSMQNGTTDYYSTSGKSQRSTWIEVVDLHEKGVTELYPIIQCLRGHIARTGSVLVRQLKRRDALRRQQQAHCDVITRTLIQRASEPVDMRFTIHPTPSESGFSQWVAAMKMVAQLPGGIPPEFRRRLWVTMAERHLASRGVDWLQVEKSCFSEWSHPADAELGVQIVKDLHRTGCSLFCGKDGQENQALLKKVLLAYARWNKAVGYCQGFNMLAALILQVTDKCESDALKLMIYLIEGVLPDSYFADSLRGLSVDMAVFRELLRSKLPKLSKHLDLLQNAAKDGSRSYEPPLTNVFTMQWFLTLFCNCLPQPTVLRVWDLIFLEGNEILLRTALAIWQVLAPRILVVKTADEFYCIMGVLTRELLEFNLIDANSLIQAVVSIGSLSELKNLRDHYLYNITPWGTAIPHSASKQINLHPKHSIPLDISALKKQYVKLKQRQRQAHIIFSAAISRHPPPATPIAMNHLLLGKSALVPSKRLGPPKGSIPPARQVPSSTLQWKDTLKPTSSSSSSDTELCDDDVHSSSEEEEDVIKSQFKDNLNSGDTNLMKTDNTGSVSESSASAETAKNSSGTSLNLPTDNNQTTSSLSTSPVNVKLTSDSEDESSDFEIFLADRIKSFKKSDNQSDEPNEVECRFTRRNSERALQIIQENSLILHRIMQCQSRLSPSPPLLFDNTSKIMDSRSDVTSNSLCPISNSIDENFEAADNSSELQKMHNVHSWINSRKETRFKNNEVPSYNISFDPEKQSPEYGSRYHSILEKSKSLDERYNSLILNCNKEANVIFLGGLHESKSETPVGSKIYSINKSQSPDCTDNSLFDALLIKTDSEGTIIVTPSSDDDPKDSKSNRLIQENLDLLKTFSVNKTRDNTNTSTEKSSLSKKLIEENVNLLESISSEKNLFGNVCGLLDKSTDFLNINMTSEESISDHDLIKDCPIECLTNLNTEDNSKTKNLNKENKEAKYLIDESYEDFFRNTPKKFDSLLTTDETDDRNNTDSYSKENYLEIIRHELVDKDSAISINFTSSSKNVSEYLVESEDYSSELELSSLALSESNIKRSHSLSPVEIKSKIDSGYSCDKKTKITEHILSSPTLNLQLVSYNDPSRNNFSENPSSPNLSKSISPDSKSIFLENPTKSPTFNDIGSANKSPSHIFNPFPVTLSSRQSKEVPLKLGIYKK